MKMFGANIFHNKLNSLLIFDKGKINTLNAYSLYLFDNDPLFRNAINHSNIVLPDGFSIQLASVFLKKKPVIKKISGYDFLIHSLEQVNVQEGKVFFLGSYDKTLESIKKRVNTEYPKVHIKTLNPGHSNNINHLSKDQIIKIINKFKPDVLFVGLGAPKQEIWIDKNFGKLNAGTICGIGAAFLYYAKTKKIPSKFFINLGLEGIIRTIKEPRQQIKKDLKAYPNFIKQVYKELKK